MHLSYDAASKGMTFMRNMKDASGKGLLLLSSIALLLLLFQPNDNSFILFPVWLIIIVIAVKSPKREEYSTKREIVLALSMLLILLSVFCVTWLKIERTAGKLNVKNIILTGSTGAVLAMASIPIAHSFFRRAMPIIAENNARFEKEKKGLSTITKKEKLVLFIFAVIAISVLSKSSPLYPFNDWVDTNIFLTVGKSIVHGKVLYRDIYEQKGPLLFLIYVLPALVSKDSFIGVYFLECISAYFFLLYSYKIAILFSPVKLLWLMPAYAFITYSATSFMHGGSVEELCIPMITCSLYFLTKCMACHEDSISLREAFLSGIFLGCIFWIKYTMIGVYVGYAAALIVICFLHNKKSYLIKTIGIAFSGVGAASVPVFFYFAVNKAFPDLWTTYFYNNLFYYQADKQDNLILTELTGIVRACVDNLAIFILIFIGSVFLLEKNKRIFSAIMLCFATTAALVFARTPQRYYSFIFAAFAPFGLGMIMQTLAVTKMKSIKLIGTIASLVLCLWGLWHSSNRYMLLQDIKELPQYQLAQTINSSEDRSLLNYGVLDVGLYTMTGTIPDVKYFCKINMNLQEMTDEQERYIEEGIDHFVVTRNKQLNASNYHLVDTAEGYFEGKNRTYYLYERNDNATR